MKVIGIVAVIVVAIFINGLVAKVEDGSPGGVENREGSWKKSLLKPKAHQVVIWLAGMLVIVWLAYLWGTK